MDELDPVSNNPARHGGWLFAEWKKEQAGGDPELIGPFRWDLAPDQLHKANFSGGSHGVELHFLGVDPPFVDEENGLPFVEYLRLGFRFAGFPGLELYVQQADVREFIEEMTDGFVPFSPRRRRCSGGARRSRVRVERPLDPEYGKDLSRTPGTAVRGSALGGGALSERRCAGRGGLRERP